MATDSDAHRHDDPSNISQVSNLQSEIKGLSETAQQLLTDKLLLESEISQVKKRASRLEEEIRNLRTPPMVIGHIQDITDEGAIVRSSNGTVFLVSVNPRINDSLLIPGARVALNQDNLSVIEVLSDSWDPLVVTSEIIEKPSVAFDDVGGLEEQIVQIREAVELSFTNREDFERFSIDPPKGVLLTGPPGTGKTLMAKAVANATNATFIRLIGSELVQKYIGEGARLVRELFQLAQERAPSIIFIDELDAVGAKRMDVGTTGDREVQRTLMQLLGELDGFTPRGQVSIMGASNRPDILDEALLRPGRFDRIIKIPLQEEEARNKIIKIHSNAMNIAKGVNYKKLAADTEGFSGADLRALCVEAGMKAIKDNKSQTTYKNFTEALEKIRNRLDDSEISEPENGLSY